ncbi:LysR family transcriptional regulator [Nocardia jinanensis]|uniref:LysR family transcriptional regulator n=1 Tax=Nocardia jinanensis TaxID=382504 RepID=A0A917RTB5_9NOCA|nr:LysR family transcriptional regulator [Nocardia jinanensis]GGL27726.1 LysR family transcriptional regulator [Nocardia jinanensis]
MGELDLATVRAFVTVADEGQFSAAAALLGISQQAVSKRIARLEHRLGLDLFHRVPTGATLTAAAARFLPHARSLLAVADEAVATVVRQPRPLRVAVLGERATEMRAMRYYLGRHPDRDTEIVLTNAFVTSRDALVAGRVDAAFARAHGGPRTLPARIAAIPFHLDLLHLLVGKDHPLAGHAAVPLAELAGATVWVPGTSVESEWTDYYRELSRYSGVVIDSSRRSELFPDVATGRGPAPIAMVIEHIADSDTLATFSADGFESPWHPHIRRVPVVDPTPAYPHALLWDETDPHPGIADLVEYFRDNYNRDVAADCWIPEIDRSLFVPA